MYHKIKLFHVLATTSNLMAMACFEHSPITRNHSHVYRARVTCLYRVTLWKNRVTFFFVVLVDSITGRLNNRFLYASG